MSSLGGDPSEYSGPEFSYDREWFVLYPSTGKIVAECDSRQECDTWIDRHGSGSSTYGSTVYVVAKREHRVKKIIFNETRLERW